MMIVEMAAEDKPSRSPRPCAAHGARKTAWRLTPTARRRWLYTRPEVPYAW